MASPDNLEDVCGVWIFGTTGAGKSHYLRQITDGDHYVKIPNKWWDGYQQQEFVGIEDFDICHKVLGYHLKIWADKYAFTAEVKGSTVFIRPKKIIVTSNWSPDQIWGDQMQTLEPILRRFELIEMKDRQVISHTKWCHDEKRHVEIASENPEDINVVASYAPGFNPPEETRIGFPDSQDSLNMLLM